MPKPVAETWYETHPMADGITLIRETHIASWLRCNMWHVRGRDRDLIIDTGMGLRPLVQEIAILRDRPVTAIISHTHFDHAAGLYQFSDRCGHSAEAEVIADPTPYNTVADTGYVRSEAFLALPWAGFEPTDFVVKPAPLTELLDEGDVVDLGDRHFKIVHLPGHSPGSIGLYETQTGTFFSGDILYDGELLDTLYHSDAEIYRDSLRRLREMPISLVHGGHFASFGRDRMRELIDAYLAGWNRLGASSEWVSSQIGDPK
ncbi:MAG: MBL fold metallo-hydrolase [Pseudomonadota bacterium]